MSSCREEGSAATDESLLFFKSDSDSEGGIPKRKHSRRKRKQGERKKTALCEESAGSGEVGEESLKREFEREEPVKNGGKGRRAGLRPSKRAPRERDSRKKQRVAKRVQLKRPVQSKSTNVKKTKSKTGVKKPAKPTGRGRKLAKQEAKQPETFSQISHIPSPLHSQPSVVINLAPYHHEQRL